MDGKSLFCVSRLKWQFCLLSWLCKMFLSGEMTQSGHRQPLTFQCYLLPSRKKLQLQNPSFSLFIYLFIFFREKTLFQRNRECCLFIEAIKYCEMISKKFLARIVHCPKCIKMTKRKWQIVSLHIDTCLIALILPVWRMHLSICSFKHICFISV